MCNLNIVFKTNKNDRDITSFLMGVTSNSYISNSDGDGIFVNNKLTKGFNKIDLFKLKKEITPAKIVITHQRKATSGFSEKWVQPFVNSEFTLVHNGIVNDFLGNKGSDTWGFFTKFTREFNKQTTGNREEKIVKAIKILLDNRDNQFYSILILDKKTNISYYFKEQNASIHFYFGKDLLYITTNPSNEKLLTTIKEDLKEIEIKDYKIYGIKVDKDINIFSVGKISQKGQKKINTSIWRNQPDKWDWEV